MLTEERTTTTQLPAGPPTRTPPPLSRLPGALAFTGAFSIVLLYALPGGAYDLVVFESYGLVIWWLLAVGIALKLLPRARPSTATLLLGAAVLAYAGWTAASLAWTESAERTTIELARSLDYLGVIALIASTLDRDTWRPAAAGLGAAALAVCWLALASRLAPGAFGADQVALTAQTGRLSYPFGYWNAVGAWAAMSIAIGLAWSAHDGSRLRRSAVLASLPAASAVVYLSYSRAAVAGALLAVIIVLAAGRNRTTAVVHALLAAAGSAAVILAIRSAGSITRAAGTIAGVLVLAIALCAGGAWLAAVLRTDRLRLRRSAFNAAATAALTSALIAGAVLGPHAASRAWHSFTHPVITRSSDPAARLLNLSGSRYYVWRSALRSFASEPATGTGAGTFAFWWNRHATDNESLHDAHNIWLQNMAELGVPGLALIIALTGTALAVAVLVRLRARRRASAGAATAFLAAFVVYLLHASVDWMWESTAVTVLALAGVAALSARFARPIGAIRRPIRVALVIVALGAGAIQVPGLLSTAELRRSQAAERAGNAQLALAWANDAVDAEPWSASAYEQRGLVLEGAGEYAQAAADLRRAIDREPTNFTHWLILARIQTERGRLSAAVRDYQHAHRLRPVAAVFVLAQ